MAQWKKIIVSGSNVSQLANDAGYITGLPANLFTGSAQVALSGDLTGTAANAQIAAGAVGTTELAAGAVTAAKLAGSIGLISSSAQLTDVVKTSGAQTVGGDKTFSDNVTISGDLTVNGTTTVISTTNLAVEDKYIALGSGTTSGGNGGIVVVSGSVTGTEVGYGFAYNNNIVRWGFSKGTIPLATKIPPKASEKATQNGINWVPVKKNPAINIPKPTSNRTGVYRTGSRYRCGISAGWCSGPAKRRRSAVPKGKSRKF